MFTTPKISADSELNKKRDELLLTLEEQQRLEDEGGNVPNKEQARTKEAAAQAIKRIDQNVPVESFPAAK